MVKENVKINSDLLRRIKTLIQDKEKKVYYPTAKAFVNIAVLELLKKKEKE